MFFLNSWITCPGSFSRSGEPLPPCLPVKDWAFWGCPFSNQSRFFHLLPRSLFTCGIFQSGVLERCVTFPVFRCACPCLKCAAGIKFRINIWTGCHNELGTNTFHVINRMSQLFCTGVIVEVTVTNFSFYFKAKQSIKMWFWKKSTEWMKCRISHFNVHLKSDFKRQIHSREHLVSSNELHIKNVWIFIYSGMLMREKETSF